MKLIFLAMFLLITSSAQAISNEDEDFNMNFTSENRSIIQSNEQAQNLHGNLYGNGNIEVSPRLVEGNNEHKHELSVTIRKGGGGRGGGRGRGGGGGRGVGGSRGRFFGGRAGGVAAAGVVGAGVAGSESANHGNHHSKSSATSLMEGPCFCVSTFILCVSFLF